MDFWCPFGRVERAADKKGDGALCNDCPDERRGQPIEGLVIIRNIVCSVDNKPVRWRVENSWSSTAGTDGYFVMSDAWMDEFCYQAVVDPSVVNKDVRDVLKQKPKVLPLWDPMGALA